VTGPRPRYVRRGGRSSGGEAAGTVGAKAPGRRSSAEAGGGEPRPGAGGADGAPRFCRRSSPSPLPRGEAERCGFRGGARPGDHASARPARRGEHRGRAFEGTGGRAEAPRPVAREGAGSPPRRGPRRAAGGQGPGPLAGGGRWGLACRRTRARPRRRRAVLTRSSDRAPAASRAAATRVRAAPNGRRSAIDGRRVDAVRESWLVEDRWWTDRPDPTPLLGDRDRRRAQRHRLPRGSTTAAGFSSR
jgi:hypothetical protein